ncbi:trafficking protein particle complex subunit 8-like isoform X2 [Mytilus galloprovincialis]|uniref:trafficking protein particle complex subunit 8-like isoform X2 n=1 Tax=Mytilus galloprovincialis TaxID=29158 RepID=UPI003F7BA943
MAQCKQNAQEFVQNTFNPHVAVLCSRDAEVLCQKNNLTFVELVQPFCRLTSEVHIRDPNNVPHTIRHLKITMRDMSATLPQQSVAKKILNDIVAGAQPQLVEGNRGNVVSVGNYDLQLTSTTPWFEAYREKFLQMLPPSDHDFLNHCLGCVFVVSSGHTDPLSMFNSLVNQQSTQQTQNPSKIPRWFCPGTLRYYVLLHDVIEGEDAKADAIYQSMKSTYGANVCHLLNINSRSIHTAESLKTDNNLPDPWSQFLNKKNTEQPVKKQQKTRYFIAWEGADYDIANGSGADDAGFPGKVTEGNIDQTSVTDSMMADLSDTGDASSGSSDLFDHPLSLMDHSSNSINHIDDQLSPDGTSSPESSHNYSYSKNKSSDKNKPSSGHGMCLTTSDQDRLKIFIHEFCVRALIPWAEKHMRILNDQLTSRKGIHRSLFSATKKWFGGNKPVNQAATNQNTTVVYTTEAPELQMRRLADLAFLFQMYDFAYRTYHTAKRDFNNDHAWLHYAGALEMACIAMFMDPQEQKYPFHYMESAIQTYLQTCKNPLYAARATVVSTEALKSRRMYHEAALQFIKLTSEDSDLRSALLLEQAAHCYINIEVPKVRKYSFHMILAGHRFSKAGQRKHSLRSYSQALQVYKGKGWALAEDHINFTLGRQSFNLKHLENATAAFKHLLTENSKQTAGQQGAFFREYLFVYKQLLTQEAGELGDHSGPLPELPLPIVDSNETKVLLGSRPQPSQVSDKVAVSGVWFDHSECNHPRWTQMEERLVSSANNGFLPPTFRPTLQVFTNKTNNKYNPVGFVGESIVVEAQLVNPLKVMLMLTEVSLLWTFLPALPGTEKPQLITNEVLSNVKNTLANEIIYTQVIDSVTLQANEQLPVQLVLVPHQTGELRIVGLAFHLGTAQTEGPKSSNTLYVRGKQKLEVQGPRLNNSKEEKASKMYGPDRRLDLVIQQEMPQLQVSFCNFPQTLLCGEVHAIMLQFTNIGSSPLHKLKVGSSSPEFFTLGSHGEIPKFPTVYQESSEVPNKSSSCEFNSKMTNIKSCVVDIALPNGVLQPKNTLSVPAWIRGNDIGGVHETHFMFYYEPIHSTPKPRYRLLRHTAVINTLESLSVRAVARRGNNSSQTGGTTGSCVVFCELENLSQVQAQRAHVKEVQINQVSCASDRWTIQHLSSQQKKSEIQVGSRETMQICLKAIRSPTNIESIKGKDCVLFSDVSFDNQQICSSLTPCADFYFCSKAKLSSDDTLGKTAGEFSDLKCAIQIGLTLVIIWKAFVINDTGEVQIRVGQHHVHIEKIDTIFTSYPIKDNSDTSNQGLTQGLTVIKPDPPPLKFIKTEEDEDENKKLDSEVTTQLVDISFSHKSNITHNFRTSRVCIVPVVVMLHNCSKVPVEVLIDTSKSPDRLNSRPENLLTNQAYPSHSSCFNWVSQTMTQLKIEPNQQKPVRLSAGFSKPGIFNLNRLSVFVTYTSDSSQMVLQKHNSPSVIVVNDVS